MAAKKAYGSKDETPVFLKKTFQMIRTCNPDVATWSEDGLVVIVKDPDTLSAEVIPQFFKHNKFSSFVRQLNLYGFRKIKTDSLRLPEDHADALYSWRFKHESFVRGRPDLLKEIRRANHANSTEEGEVDKLKREVSHLRAEIGKLTAMVQQMATVLQQAAACNMSVPEPTNKKRKFEADHVGSLPTEQGSMQYHEQQLTGCWDDSVHPDALLVDPLSDADLLVEDMSFDYQPGGVTLSTKRAKPISDEDLLVEDAPLQYQPGKVTTTSNIENVESVLDLVNGDKNISCIDPLQPCGVNVKLEAMNRLTRSALTRNISSHRTL